MGLLAAEYQAAADERRRAHEKHAASGNSMEDRGPWDVMWLPVLMEEVGEVARVLCDYPDHPAAGVRALREEAVQVAAMALAWVAACDREAARQRGRKGGA